MPREHLVNPWHGSAREQRRERQRADGRGDSIQAPILSDRPTVRPTLGRHWREPLPPACAPTRGDQRGRAVSRRPLSNVPSNSEWMLLSGFHRVRAGSAMSALASAAEGLAGSPRTNCYTRPVRAWRVRSRTDKPGTRWKSVSIVTSVKLRSSAVAAIKVSISPIRPGPWGGRNARRRSA